MKRLLLICLSVLLALAAVAVTALAMESRFAQEPSPVGPAQDGTARVAVAHLAPFSTTTAVDVWLDGMPVPQLANFEFGDSTSYLEILTGTHLIEIYPVGSPMPALTATVDLEAQDYTAIAIGGANGWDLELRLLEDDNSPPSAAGMAKVRVGHLAPFTAAINSTVVDVRRQDGVLLVDNLPYRFVTVSPSYKPAVAGTHDLKVTSPDGSVTLIDPLPITFNEGDIVSIFAVGDGANQPLGVFALPSDQPGALLPLARYQWLPITLNDATPQ
jgi:hypothetical protein